MPTLSKKSSQQSAISLQRKQKPACRSTFAGVPDLVQRLAAAPEEVYVELIRRGAFEVADLEALDAALGKRVMKTAVERAASVRSVIRAFILARPILPRIAFIPALANCDRQIQIHAVINGHLTGDELLRFQKLIDMQTDGHMLQQVRTAVEREIGRRQHGGTRSGRNHIVIHRG